MDKLENHIDEPIKKSVVGMALLGFVPVFSCCGFNYHGEKVKKTHMLEKPYIYLSIPDLDDKLKALLLSISIKCQWKINIINSSFIDFHGHKWDSDHPWSAEGCPHKPEMPVLAIHSLEKALEEYKNNNFRVKAIIQDGNDLYKNKWGIKHWQYEPCEDWEVTPQTFDSL